MIKVLVMVGLVAVPAAVGLGLWAGQNSVGPDPVLAVRQNAPLVAKPGREAASAAKSFAKLEPPPPPKPAALPGPPPPDVAVVFRREMRALAPDQGRVILAGSKSLKLGDSYADGWKLSALSSRAVTFTKGKEQRVIDPFQPDPVAVQALAARAQAPMGLAQVSFTNGLKPGQLPSSMISQLVTMMRQSGLAETQIAQMKKALESGPATQGQMMPLVMAMARNGRVPITELGRFVDSLARAGVIPVEQVASINQSVASVAQSRQTDTIVQQLGRQGAPGPGQGGRGGFPGQGFGGGRGQGGFGGGGGQGRQVIPPNNLRNLQLAPQTGQAPIVRVTP